MPGAVVDIDIDPATLEAYISTGGNAPWEVSITDSPGTVVTIGRRLLDKMQRMLGATPVEPVQEIGALPPQKVPQDLEHHTEVHSVDASAAAVPGTDAGIAYVALDIHGLALDSASDAQGTTVEQGPPAGTEAGVACVGLDIHGLALDVAVDGQGTAVERDGANPTAVETAADITPEPDFLEVDSTSSYRLLYCRAILWTNAFNIRICAC